MLGVRQHAVERKIRNLLPDYMAMGERGMAEMANMKMHLPGNTLPMTMGDGPFGNIEMGGCLRGKGQETSPLTTIMAGTGIPEAPWPGQ